MHWFTAFLFFFPFPFTSLIYFADFHSFLSLLHFTSFTFLSFRIYCHFYPPFHYFLLHSIFFINFTSFWPPFLTWLPYKPPLFLYPLPSATVLPCSASHFHRFIILAIILLTSEGQTGSWCCFFTTWQIRKGYLVWKAVGYVCTTKRRNSFIIYHDIID